MIFSHRLIIFCSVILVSGFYFHLSSSKKPTLDKNEIISLVRDYDMSHMINRCKKDHGYSDTDMHIIEKEFKRFFTMCGIKKSTDSGRLGMYSRDVDNLWHTFILFTKEYTQFCKNTFGRYIHHEPRVKEIETDEDRAQARVNFKGFIETYEQFFGEEIHPIWLLDAAEKNTNASVA